MEYAILIPQFGNLIVTVFAFILCLSIIVFVHEFGHYYIGTLSGIHAEVFSIGFGPVLLSLNDKNGTKWQISALPLGGFVKFLGDKNSASSPNIDLKSARGGAVFNRATMQGAPLWARFITVAAGPLFNFMRTSTVPDIVVYSKSFGGGKSSISGYTTTKALFNSSYGSTNDALMHSTTYNAFGEETLTAIVAIEVALEEEFEKKSKNLQNLLETGFKKLSERYKFFHSFSGMGALYGLEFELPELYKQLEKIFQNFDKKFFKKLYVGALIDHLYSEHNILTYFTDNKKVCLAISPSLITSEKDINYLFDSLDKTFDKNQFLLVNTFIKNVGTENLKLIFK